ncbi:MAG: hypothetical protein ACI9TH_002766 [Kiritimatiellia bacterium]|jgi:hypothetical protein
MKRRDFIQLAGAGAALGALRSDANTQPGSATVHEWGTFTTVHGSDGKLLSGLQEEEEHLPWFVYSHAGMKKSHDLPGAGFSPAQLKRMGSSTVRKGFNRPLANVTVKMETPVLYFYADEPQRAKVKVGFEGGSISQWFPQRSGGETVVPPTKANNHGQIDFGQSYTGGIEWEVNVLAPDSKAAFTAAPEWGYAMWPAARVAEANKLQAGEEIEHFLFYRGVGNFQIPFEVSAPDDSRIRLRNTGAEAISHAFVFDRRHHGIPKLWWQGELPAGKTVEAVESPHATGLHAIRTTFIEKLVEAGLNVQEAHAMVNTWQTSYFDKPGLRVFWIAPRAYTDRILPIEIDPVPKQLERVIVGRSEVLTPGFEQTLLNEYQRDQLKSFYGDRYHLAYTERAQQLIGGGV